MVEEISIEAYDVPQVFCGQVNAFFLSFALAASG
ncbi:MAG: hypothetical protein JWQ71_4669 [Pedosphaera sp.]|nr:hypothetical protein [Pedosphaera sp.]